MCGIVGVFNFNEGKADEQPFLQWALGTMKHRGPDSNGTWSHRTYHAGFVRLAIRDLSENGLQPMISDCGQYSLSFNGEIYNTEAFRKQLADKGVVFKSTTDTEVLLYGLIHFGATYVLKHFDGIFAFAFYSTTTNELLLARDRAGTKPLYIGHSTNGVVYSSQYDHVVNHAFFRKNKINEGALGAYLCLGYVPENMGIVSETWLIPHGHYVIIKNVGVTTHQYFDYPTEQIPETNQKLEQVLEGSVESQLVSDVSVGTFLSGGIDSPLVSFYANTKKLISSFTIGVDNEAIDESRAAADYAAIFKTDHHLKAITEKDLFNTINDNTRAFSEPFADFSSIPTLLLSKYARQHVTVALSGDGGDELFWGYPRNSKMLKQGLQYNKSKLRRWAEFIRQKATRSTSRSLIKKHLEEDNFPAFYYRSLFMTGADHWVPKVFKGKVKQSFWLQKLLAQTNALNTDEATIMSVLRKLEFDIHLQRILLKVDRASMFHSLEVRVPMLSNAMVAYSSQLAHTDCIEDNNGKINLKKLLISKANTQLVMQPKKGFIIPLGEWLKGSLRADIERKLLAMPEDLQQHFNAMQVQNLLTEHFAGKQDWSWFIWALYCLVNWSDHHRNKFVA